MWYFCKRDDLDFVEKLIKAGVPVNKEGKFNPVRAALESEEEELYIDLID